uniref:NADH-ubiquinone oxidoreductase chain 4 n=1 Tax=Hygrobates taniguchii TaxID=2759127 RepID=A0A6J4EFN4_9ACAR|nr:NADH dehydrogenase subunit 4 [Hygrobates taniguchii]
MGIAMTFLLSFLMTMSGYFFESLMFYLMMLLYFTVGGGEIVGLMFSMSFLSWVLILLSLFICSLMILSNISFYFVIKEMNFLMYVLMMAGALCLVFFSSSLFMFYIFFEFSIIPIFFIICSLGSSMERLESAIYMFFYTLTFSLPFLVHMLKMDFSLKSLSMFSFDFVYSMTADYFFVVVSIFMFFVKIPAFFFHLWLPKAHVEAPVSGSMVLAGLLLKLGAYGLFFYISSIFMYVSPFTELFFFWGLWGAFLASLSCFRQVDLKKMIAYMSIMHMGMVISGIMSFSEFSYMGVFLMMISHGLTSSLMFFSLNCLYERFYSRSLLIIKGGVIFIPALFFWFSASSASNIAIPPTLSFFSELLLIFSILEFYFNSWGILLTLVFMSSVVTFYFLVSIFHGFSSESFSFSFLNLKENLIHFSHLLPLIMMFVFM